MEEFRVLQRFMRMLIFLRDAISCHTVGELDGRLGALGGTNNLVTQKVSCVPGSFSLSFSAVKYILQYTEHARGRSVKVISRAGNRGRKEQIISI
jgi:hypothetical protein